MPTGIPAAAFSRHSKMRVWKKHSGQAELPDTQAKNGPDWARCRWGRRHVRFWVGSSHLANQHTINARTDHANAFHCNVAGNHCRRPPLRPEADVLTLCRRTIRCEAWTDSAELRASATKHRHR